jgi:hypothetical protein
LGDPPLVPSRLRGRFFGFARAHAPTRYAFFVSFALNA